MTGPDPTPDLTELTSTQTLLEMGKVIQESREYFTAVSAMGSESKRRESSPTPTSSL